MNAPIHQIYCTHCTFGTSALERREGDIGDRVLGYSVRAGSLSAEQLKKTFRQIERYLYYSLPSDAPSEEKLHLDALSAPRRLIFLPSIGGLQVVGQLSYRQRDTSGRVGSYFGHFLLAERNAQPWSVLQCLQLWGAPWASQDSSNIPYHLDTLPQLECLGIAARPAIDDQVLRSFLTTMPGQSFDDPQQIISPRWQKVSQAARLSLLTDVLRAFLELGSDRRESVLVVVEPSVAALLFYGVARLLPAGKLRDGISFSTFEPSPDRLPTSLAATVFHDPANTDLKPEAYRRGGWIVNTFMNRSSTIPPRSKGLYARLIVDTLTEGGWSAVDDLLNSLQFAGPTRPDDLELLAQLHGLVPAMLSSNRHLVAADLGRSQMAASFLGHRICTKLARETPDSRCWKELAVGPNGILLSELIAGLEHEPNHSLIIQSLLRHIPVERFPDLLASQRISLECKAETLAAFIQRTGRFPENCSQLWISEPTAIRPLTGPQRPLLSAVLGRLELVTLQKLHSQAPDSPAFLIALAQAAKLDPTKQSLLVQLVDDLEDDKLVDLFGRHGDELRPCYPKHEPYLSGRLRRIFDDLPDNPLRFSERLDMLRAWLDFFDNVNEMEVWLGYWEQLRREIVSLQHDLSIHHGEVGLRLAKAIELAMSKKQYGVDDRGDRRVRCLREVGQALLGRDDFLPPEVWNSIRGYLAGEIGWTASDALLSAERSGRSLSTTGGRATNQRSVRNGSLRSSRGSKNRMLIVGGIAGLCSVGLVYLLWHSGGGSEREIKTSSTINEPAATSTDVQSDPTLQKPPIGKGDEPIQTPSPGTRAKVYPEKEIDAEPAAPLSQRGSRPAGAELTADPPPGEAVPKPDANTTTPRPALAPQKPIEVAINIDASSQNSPDKGSTSKVLVYFETPAQPNEAQKLSIVGSPQFFNYANPKGSTAGTLEVTETTKSDNRAGSGTGVQFFMKDNELRSKWIPHRTEPTDAFRKKLCSRILRIDYGSSLFTYVALTPMLKMHRIPQSMDGSKCWELKLDEVIAAYQQHLSEFPLPTEVWFFSLKLGEGSLSLMNADNKTAPSTFAIALEPDGSGNRNSIPDSPERLKTGPNYIHMEKVITPDKKAWRFEIGPHYEQLEQALSKQQLALNQMQFSAMLYRTVEEEGKTIRVNCVQIGDVHRVDR